jgi:hypothetical protein
MECRTTNNCTTEDSLEKVPEKVKSATEDLAKSENADTRNIATLLEFLIAKQSTTNLRIASLENEVTEIQGKVSNALQVSEAAQQKSIANEKRISGIERDLVRIEREVNDSFIVIGGIPEEEEEGSDPNKVREVASKVLTDGGFGDLAKKIVTAWRPGRRPLGQDQSRIQGSGQIPTQPGSQNQGGKATGRIIIVKFESLQARQKIMSQVKSIKQSDAYPNRRFYPKKSPAELRGQRRMAAVVNQLAGGDHELERKWGGVKAKGDNRVFMPIDFLPSIVIISGLQINIDSLMTRK